MLKELYDKSTDEFSKLLTEINHLSSSEHGGLYLKAHHVDTIFSALQAQMTLPKDSLGVLEASFSEDMIEKTAQIERVGHQECIPQLIEQASIGNLMHHNHRHALEVMSRSMHVLTAELDTSDLSPIQQHVLKVLFSFFIRFHDLEQFNYTGTGTPEINTVVRLMFHLSSHLDIFTEHEHLMPITSFMGNHIIVLGTTMLFGQENMSFLYQIYALIETSYAEAGFIVVDASNVKLVNLLMIATLVAGACDRFPAAVKSAVHLESRLDHGIKPYYDQLTEFSLFCESSHFNHYFQGDGRHINQRALYIAMVPHLCMCFELQAKAMNELAIEFVVFIRSAQTYRASVAHAEDFNAWLDTQLLTYDIRQSLEAIFFSAIGKEQFFCRGQFNSLEFKQRVLNSIICRDLLEPSVAITDAQNLGALHAYYFDLPDVRKNQLLRELVMLVILQAGATTYLNHKVLSSSPDAFFSKQTMTIDVVPTDADIVSACCNIQ